MVKIEDMLRTNHRNLIQANVDLFNGNPTIQANIAQTMEIINRIIKECGNVWVTSGLRCPQLNRAVGGMANSKHLIGRAADIVPINQDIRSFAELIKALDEPIRVVLEPNHLNTSWIHIQLFDEV